MSGGNAGNLSLAVVKKLLLLFFFVQMLLRALPNRRKMAGDFSVAGQKLHLNPSKWNRSAEP